MLTHIVSFKYKADVPEATRQDHRQRLAGLRSLTGVVDLKVGADVVRSARSFDTGLIVTFNKEDTEAVILNFMPPQPDRPPASAAPKR